MKSKRWLVILGEVLVAVIRPNADGTQGFTIEANSAATALRLTQRGSFTAAEDYCKRLVPPGTRGEIRFLEIDASVCSPTLCCPKGGM